jgi:serine O-acetyltransferase
LTGLGAGFHRFITPDVNISKILRALSSAYVLYKFVQWTCGISLLYTVKSSGVRIWHHGGMVPREVDR